MPVVSIILPTYNRKRYLQQTIESALAQTRQKLELIIVDDGSSDGTAELIEDFMKRDDRVRYHYQDNAGVSEARNKAIDLATGEFIAFLDSDDIWKPWKLELQVELLKSKSSVGMVWTDMDAIEVDGTFHQANYLKTMYHAYRRLTTGTPFDSSSKLNQVMQTPDDDLNDASLSVGNIYHHMFFGNLVHTPTVVLRREWANKVGPFDTTMKRGGEDFKYHLATCRLGDVAFIDVASIFYRLGNGDQITSRANNLHFAHSYLRTVKEELAEHSDVAGLSRQEIGDIYAQAHDWLATELQASRSPISSIRHAMQAIYFRKSLGHSWKTMTKCIVPAAMIQLGKSCLGLSELTSHSQF